MYFNSKDQINGDKAFIKKNYEEAFQCYNRAIERLARVAFRNQYDHHIFHDNATHALADVISAKCYAFFELNKINAEESNEFWGYLKDKLDKLSINWDVLKTYHEKNITTQTNRKNVRDAYETAILACEDISDVFADKNLYQEALIWMERSINLRKQYQFPAPLQLSNGYLNLLYQQYLITKDTAHLKIMEKYISETKTDVSKNISLESLEFLSHEFMVVVILSPEKIGEAKSLCENMISQLIKENVASENDAFVVEVKESIKKATQQGKKQETPSNNRSSKSSHQSTEIMSNTYSSQISKRKPFVLFSENKRSKPNPANFSNQSSTDSTNQILHPAEKTHDAVPVMSVAAKENSLFPPRQNPLKITPKEKIVTQNRNPLSPIQNPIVIRPKKRGPDSSSIGKSVSFNTPITQVTPDILRRSSQKEPAQASEDRVLSTKNSRTNSPSVETQRSVKPAETKIIDMNVSITSVSVFNSKTNREKKKNLTWSSQLEQTHVISAREEIDIERQENSLISGLDTNIPAFHAFYNSILNSVKQDKNGCAFLLKIMGDFMNYNHKLDEIKKFQSSAKDKHHLIAINLYYASLSLNPHQPQVRKELQAMIQAPELRRYLKGHAHGNMLSQIENILSINYSQPTISPYVQFEQAVANYLSELEVNREKIIDTEAFINEMMNYIAQKSSAILGSNFETDLITNYYERLSNSITENNKPPQISR